MVHFLRSPEWPETFAKVNARVRITVECSRDPSWACPKCAGVGPVVEAGRGCGLLGRFRVRNLDVES